MLDYCLSYLPAVIVLAIFIATLFAAARSLPAQNVIAAGVLIAVISGVIQIVGAKTGVPFGPYFYTDNFGGLLFRVLPWPVPLVWAIVILNSRGAAQLILRPQRNRANYGFWLTGLTCLLVIFCDANLEPLAHANHYWIWQTSKTTFTWYGAPWINFAGWGAVTLLILGLILPWLINKKSDNPLPNYWPLVLWLLSILLLTVANVSGAGSSLLHRP